MTSDDNINDRSSDQPFDPESFSEMLNNMFSGQGTSGFGFSPMNLTPQGGPMEIAQRVAADIASRDIDKEPEPDESQQQHDHDPMAEIMHIMSILSVPATPAVALTIDSVFSARCQQIYPAAQNYVATELGVDDISTLDLVVTDRVTWTKDYIQALSGPLEVASQSLSPTFNMDESNEQGPAGFDMQSMIAHTVAPMMFGVQAGTMLGFLSHRAYGDDDILLPATLPHRVSFIASAVQKFAFDWSTPIDEAILYFLILQTIRAHIRSNGWLTQRLNDLCSRYVSAYELNPYKLEELMGEMNVDNPESVMAINVTPEQMFETLRTPTHDILDEEIGRISSLHEAYVEWAMHKNLATLLPTYQNIQEARRRITVTTSDADRFVEQLFGVAVSNKFRDQAAAFIEGVVEREREDILHRMWHDETLIPTESEFLAPGLYLARIELM